MERKIALGLLPADVLPKLRSTTVYALSALGDSFFGGSFLVMWSLVGVNMAVAGWYFFLGLWCALCLVSLQAFKAYTFARGYAQGLAFLQRLKSWNLIDCGQRIKMVNGVLLALFFVQIVPDGLVWPSVWIVGVCLLALASSLRTVDRLLLLVVLGVAGLVVPWELVRAFVAM